MRKWAALVLLALAACSPAPRAVSPALWQIDGPRGERAWLLGTIHALPAPVEWRSARVDAALAAADEVVLEVAAIEDDTRTAQAFAALARPAPGIALPPLDQRVAPAQRPALAALLARLNLDAAQLARLDSWAAALLIAQGVDAQGNGSSANGIDRAVVKAAAGKPITEFEGAAAQLEIFDGLAEADQRDLLAAVIADAPQAAAQTARLADAWERGDLDIITAETTRGMLADPELRAALLTDRNAAWTAQLQAYLRTGRRPFVAVGTAHLAGPDGLPAQLERAGYRVRRLQ